MIRYINAPLHSSPWITIIFHNSWPQSLRREYKMPRLPPRNCTTWHIVRCSLGSGACLIMVLSTSSLHPTNQKVCHRTCRNTERPEAHLTPSNIGQWLFTRPFTIMMICTCNTRAVSPRGLLWLESLRSELQHLEQRHNCTTGY